MIAAEPFARVFREGRRDANYRQRLRARLGWLPCSATREFFELVRDRLLPGGVVIVNAGHPRGQDDLEKVLGATMSAVFPTVVRDPAEDINTLLLGTTGEASRERLVGAIPNLPEDLWPRANSAAERLGPRLKGGTVLHGRQGAGRVAHR